MGGFSRTAAPSSIASCANMCIDAKAKDQILLHGARERARVVAQRRQQGSICDTMAKEVPGRAARMERYEAALPGARAARDLNELGDKDGAPVNQPCITRLPLDARRLNQKLGIDPNSPGAITDKDLRNDATGYRAALYRDDTNGRLILVSRDTQPHSLVDWRANINNGQGRDDNQYRSIRGLSRKLVANGKTFDIAGYSKGGGLAQEAGLVSPDSKVYVFNSAGLGGASLASTGQANFASLMSRTSSFSAQDDFLTYVNNTTDPAQKVANARFLRSQLAGPSGWGLDALARPMQLQYLNPANKNPADPGFLQQRAAFLKDLDSLIAGGKVDFPPVRAAITEVIPNSIGKTKGIPNDWPLLNARSDQPTVGKLAQHQIANIVGPDATHPGPMEKQIAADRQFLGTFRSRCG